MPASPEYDRGFDDGFCDGGNAERDNARKVVDAAKALLVAFAADPPASLVMIGLAATLETAADEWEAEG